MNNEKIRWASIQPLTGGMYLGAEEAIGHPAEFILSYKGLSDVKYDKSGENIVDAGNEYNLLEYLKKHNRCPKYYQLHKGMFDMDLENMNPEIYLNDELETPSYDNLDLVVAVPVCSGLSMVTTATDDTKNARNCNMLWISKYTLSVIKPKIYIFENAPTFMGVRGTELRAQFEEMAMELGYSILYYKTDSNLHHNCQLRPRTFVIFFKHTKEEAQRPFMFEWEDTRMTIEEFFAQIDNDNLTQNEPVQSSPHNYMVIDFIKRKYGDQWKDIVTGSLMQHCIDKKYLDELIDFIKNVYVGFTDEIKAKALKYIEHIKYKKSLGLNYFGDDVCLCKNRFPSIQFKSIPNMLHPSGERICSCREYLSLMGMPTDFTLYGGRSCLNKIGQNVPVKTAKFIVEQAIKHLDVWNNERLTDTNVMYQDNIKQMVVDYK
jgi:site-specific DNA-cytosine methylase